MVEAPDCLDLLCHHQGVESARSALAAMTGVLAFATVLCAACWVLTPSSERARPQGMVRRNPMAAGLWLDGRLVRPLLIATVAVAGIWAVVAALSVLW